MKLETRISLTKNICKIFPPIISQRLRSYLYPIELARKEKINFTRKSITGSYLESNTRDFHGYNFFFHGFFDWRNVIIANAISKHKNGDIIEIGANIGTETVSFCDIVNSNGKVHAFEPLPINIKQLKKLSNIQTSLNVFEYALSDKNGESTFLIPNEEESGTGKIITYINCNGKDVLKVKTRKLDNFSREFNNVNLISIDTEGHEPFVLHGSKNILTKYNPIVIIEVSPKLLIKYANSEPKDISDHFNELNYNIFKINKFSISKISENDLLTRKASNWVCIPKNRKKIERQIKLDLILRTFIPWYLLKTLPNTV